MEELALRVDRTHRLVVKRLRDRVILETQTPTHGRDGHGWGIVTQLQLDREYVKALQLFLKGAL